MKIERFVLGPVMANCYVVSDNGEAVIIDPGFRSNSVCDYIKENSLKVKMILLTHGHFDHILGAKYFSDKYSAKIAIGEGDKMMPLRRDLNGADRCGLLHYEPFKADIELKEGDEIKFGSITFKVIETPGHSPGGLCFYTQGYLFCGDTVFKGNIGRADLTGGDFDTLISSIKNKIYALPDDTVIYCGHEDNTTVAYEKKNNYYVRG